MGSAATQRALCRTDAGSVVKAEENASCYLEPAATIARMGTRRTKDKLKCLQWLEKPVTIDSVMAVRYGVQAFGGFNCVPRYASTTMVEIPYTIQSTGCVWNLELDGLASGRYLLKSPRPHHVLYTIVDCRYLNFFSQLQKPVYNKWECPNKRWLEQRFLRKIFHWTIWLHKIPLTNPETYRPPYVWSTFWVASSEVEFFPKSH